MRRRAIGPAVLVVLLVLLFLPLALGRSLWLRDALTFTYPLKAYLRARHGRGRVGAVEPAARPRPPVRRRGAAGRLLSARPRAPPRALSARRRSLLRRCTRSSPRSACAPGCARAASTSWARPSPARCSRSRATSSPSSSAAAPTPSAPPGCRGRCPSRLAGAHRRLVGAHGPRRRSRGGLVRRRARPRRGGDARRAQARARRRRRAGWRWRSRWRRCSSAPRSRSRASAGRAACRSSTRSTSRFPRCAWSSWRGRARSAPRYGADWLVHPLYDEGTGQAYQPFAAGIYVGLATPLLALAALVARAATRRAGAIARSPPSAPWRSCSRSGGTRRCSPPGSAWRPARACSAIPRSTSSSTTLVGCALAARGLGRAARGAAARARRRRRRARGAARRRAVGRARRRPLLRRASSAASSTAPSPSSVTSSPPAPATRWSSRWSRSCPSRWPRAAACRRAAPSWRWPRSSSPICSRSR